MPEQVVTFFSQNRFRMELYAFYRKRLVAHAHDLAVFAPRGNLQALRKAVLFNHERVVARSDEWIRQRAKHAFSVVHDRRRLAMHEVAGMHDAAAERLADALVAQTHTQHRNL